MSSHPEVFSGGVLHVTVHHVYYPVTEETLQQVFVAYGVVKTSVFQRINHMEAVVQLRSRHGAARALALHGRCIYERACLLDIQDVSLEYNLHLCSLLELKQTATVAEYTTAFWERVHRVLDLNSDLNIKCFVDQYVNGLCNDIQAAVRSRSPSSITSASCLARIREDEIVKDMARGADKLSRSYGLTPTGTLTDVFPDRAPLAQYRAGHDITTIDVSCLADPTPTTCSTECPSHAATAATAALTSTASPTLSPITIEVFHELDAPVARDKAKDINTVSGVPPPLPWPSFLRDGDSERLTSSFKTIYTAEHQWDPGILVGILHVPYLPCFQHVCMFGSSTANTYAYCWKGPHTTEIGMVDTCSLLSVSDGLFRKVAGHSSKNDHKDSSYCQYVVRHDTSFITLFLPACFVFSMLHQLKRYSSGALLGFHTHASMQALDEERRGTGVELQVLVGYWHNCYGIGLQLNQQMAEMMHLNHEQLVEVTLWINNLDMVELVYDTPRLQMFIGISVTRMIWFVAWLLNYHGEVVHTDCQIIKASKYKMEEQQKFGGIGLRSCFPHSVWLPNNIRVASLEKGSHSSKQAQEKFTQPCRFGGVHMSSSTRVHIEVVRLRDDFVKSECFDAVLTQGLQWLDLLIVVETQGVYWVALIPTVTCAEVSDAHAQWDPGGFLLTMIGEHKTNHTIRSRRLQRIGAQGYRMIIGMKDLTAPWDPGIVAFYESAVPVRVKAERPQCRSGSYRLLQPVHAIAWGQAMFCGGGSVTPDVLPRLHLTDGLLTWARPKMVQTWWWKDKSAGGQRDRASKK